MKWEKRFFATTRGRIVAELRQGPRTAEEIARTLRLTTNAIRSQLVALERDGLVDRTGLRPSGGKPAYSYELTEEAEALFSKACALILEEFVNEVKGRLTSRELNTILRGVGARLAAARKAGGRDQAAKLAGAVKVLNDLGGLADLQRTGSTFTIRSRSCPIGDLVSRHPELCRLVEALLAEVTALQVRERCQRTGRPRCRFLVGVKA
jgi:DeoR family suf operon transcriptional repressor